MKIVYEDVVPKRTKEFVFKVYEMNDGTYMIIQQAFRVFPDNGKALKSEKKGNCSTVEELMCCASDYGRQGKLFLDSQFFMQVGKREK